MFCGFITITDLRLRLREGEKKTTFWNEVFSLRLHFQPAEAWSYSSQGQGVFEAWKNSQRSSLLFLPSGVFALHYSEAEVLNAKIRISDLPNAINLQEGWFDVATHMVRYHLNTEKKTTFPSVSGISLSSWWKCFFSLPSSNHRLAHRGM